MTEENPHKIKLWTELTGKVSDDTHTLECAAEGCNWKIPTMSRYQHAARAAAQEHIDTWNLRQANAGHAALIAKVSAERDAFKQVLDEFKAEHAKINDALFDAGTETIPLSAGVEYLVSEFKRLRELEAKLLKGDASDGYHTHKELYAYRLAFHAHAAMLWHALGYPVVKSWKHHDGEPCFGKSNYFIVVAQLPTGQVSNHYAGKFWDLFRVPFVETAPEWDGHDPKTAEKRIRESIAKVDLDNFLAVSEGSKSWIEELKKDSAILHALYAWGVDNWVGYEDAMESVDKED